MSSVKVVKWDKIMVVGLLRWRKVRGRRARKRLEEMSNKLIWDEEEKSRTKYRGEFKKGCKKEEGEESRG